jgi:hypothetical protein
MSQLKLTADSGGGTVAIKGPASTTGNAALDLTVPGTASGTLDTLKRAGNILQVISTTKTDQFTSTAYDFTDVTGMSVSITPASASNKILINFELQVGGTANNYAAFRLLRDSTHIGVSTVTDTDWKVATLGSLSHENSYQLENTGTSFLDSPNTTSAITYKLQVSSYSNRTVSINYPTSTGNSAGSYTATGISTITVMEVAA